MTWRNPAQAGRSLDPSFESQRHTDQIAEAIAALPARSDPPGRLLVAGHSPASRIGSVTTWGMLWWLATHPAARVTYVTYSKPAATAMGRRLRETVKRNGAELGLQIAGHTPEFASWELRSGGGVTCCAPTSRPRGNADLLVIEDPHMGAVEAVRPQARLEVVTNCRLFLERHLNPGAPAIVAMLPGTRDTLAGALTEEGGWRTIQR